MEDRKLTERLSIAVDADLLRYIDMWRRDHADLPSRSRAARLLIEDALKARGIPTTNAAASFVHAAPPAAKPKPAKKAPAKRKART